MPEQSIQSKYQYDSRLQKWCEQLGVYHTKLPKRHTPVVADKSTSFKSGVQLSSFFEVKAPVGQACTHSPQLTQVLFKQVSDNIEGLASLCYFMVDFQISNVDK
jgi:acyl-CoA thioesterase FadM